MIEINPIVDYPIVVIIVFNFYSRLLSSSETILFSSNTEEIPTLKPNILFSNFLNYLILNSNENNNDNYVS